MKYIYFFIAFVFSIHANAQCVKKQTREKEKQQQQEKFVVPNDNKLPNRPELENRSKNSTTERTKTKANKNQKVIHWYALELENDSVYWKNVDCSKVLIELEKGININDDAIQSFLIEHNLTEILNKSMFPDLQNFYEFKLSNGNKSTIIAIAKAAKNIKGIMYVEPASIGKSNGGGCVPNDTYWNNQWGPYVIYADVVYCDYIGTSNQIIGVIDDAIDWYHEDLYDMVWYGYDFGENDNDPTPSFTGQNHGTHVTGTVAATIHNSTGVAGILNDTIYFAKVDDDIDNNILTSSGIINALNAISSNPRIRTFNMSFGNSSPSQAQENAVDNTWYANQLPIATAGNDASSDYNYPAAYANVVCVSAVGVDNNSNLTDASYSNYGNWIDISAPGGELATGYGILSSLPNDNYDYYEGTSMAAPHATGVAALIFDANPFLTNYEAWNVLEAGVIDLGSPGYDIFFGTGMVCMPCAVDEACNLFDISIVANGATTFCPGGNVTLVGDYHIDITYQWEKDGVLLANTDFSSGIANESGTYILHATSLLNCTASSNPITVTVVPNPVANFSSSQNGLVVTFTNNSSNGNTYLWDFGDGQTSTQFNPTHIYANTGNYNVILTVYNSCGASSILTNQISILTTEISYSDLLNQFNVYPNPSNGTFTIQPNFEKPTDASISIFNTLGEIVKAIDIKQVSNSAIEINLENTAGLYFAEFKTPLSSITKKIIIQ